MMPTKSKLVGKIERVKQNQASKEPVWAGPESNASNGGVTQSLLGNFLSCRERFRLKVIEGLKPADEFSPRISYGSMWHICEEALAKGGSVGTGYVWDVPLRLYCAGLAKQYPTQGSQVNHWYEICRTQFPIYVKYWESHRDVTSRTPLLQEQVFSVPYKLPSGRVVKLRGKWDSVDLIGKGKNAGVYLQENKTKGDINEQQMQRQLTWDLQTLLYAIALTTLMDFAENGTDLDTEDVLPLDAHWGNLPYELRTKFKGVRYNVIRRPLSGGKGTIRQHQPTKSNPNGESSEEFYERLGAYIKADPAFYFMRWTVSITPGDIERFKRECLNPVLENLADDYDWWNFCVIAGSNPFDYLERERRFPDHRSRMFRLPYGIWNSTLEGRVGDMDEFLATGSEVGLERVENLFTELT